MKKIIKITDIIFKHIETYSCMESLVIIHVVLIFFTEKRFLVLSHVLETRVLKWMISKVHLEEQKVENGDNLKENMTRQKKREMKENMTRQKALLSIMVLSSYKHCGTGSGVTESVKDLKEWGQALNMKLSIWWRHSQNNTYAQ